MSSFIELSWIPSPWIAEVLEHFADYLLTQYSGGYQVVLVAQGEHTSDGSWGGMPTRLPACGDGEPGDDVV